MASYTKNLNLLKKDPVADGADTFNIETMLNENWDKIDENVATGAAMQAHITNQKNPHNVTAAQIGAAASVHSHTMGQVEGLNTALSNKADKGAPPQYDFQFAEGFKSYQPCRYWKNDFGEVTISLAEFENLIELSPNTRYLIGTMPEGYLPYQQSFGAGLCNTADSARCFVNWAGQVYFYPSTEVGAGSKWNTGIIKYMALAE